MSSFELNERLGFTPPFDFPDLQKTVNEQVNLNPKRRGFYAHFIDFEKLAKAIKASKPEKVLRNFDYTHFVSEAQKVVDVEDPETGEVFQATLTVSIPFSITDTQGNTRDLQLSGRLNKKLANVQTDITVARVLFEPKINRISYNLLFIYESFDNRKNNTSKSDINRVAIDISTYTYEDYNAAISYLGFRNDQSEKQIISTFNPEFLRT